MALEPHSASHSLPPQPADLPSVDHLLLDGPVEREMHLLQLQVEELLNEVRFDCGTESVAEILAMLSQTLTGIPEQEVEPKDLGSFLKILPLTTQRALKFQPPKSVVASGAYVAHTLANPECIIDVLVTMPHGCFLQKDHINHQYHVRRALYLTVLASALKKNKAFRHQEWQFQNQDPRKPVLLVHPKQKSNSLPPGLRFRILTCLDPAAFSLTKLAPDRNNLRSVCIRTAADEPQLLPTPTYNTSILEDMFPDASFLALQRASSQLPQFLDASLLLKVWARKQGLEVLHRQSSEDLLPLFAAHLAASGKLTPAMSAIQIFRAVLKAIADPKTFKNGVFMGRQDPAGATTPPAAGIFRQHFKCQLVDPSGWSNAMAHLSPAFLKQLQQQAKASANVLERLNSAEEAFELLFLVKRPTCTQFDYFWRVSLPKDQEDSLTGDLSSYREWEAQVEDLARKALGERAELVYVFPRAFHSNTSLEIPGPRLEQSSMLLAAKVNAEHAFRGVDIGPAADSPEAGAFREFWGGKSEMRKFLDGRICEVVAWDGGSSARHTILDSIVTYILHQHMDAQVWGSSDCVDWVLGQKGHARGDQLNARRLADAALGKLGKQLRGLTTLPLKITTLQPISAESRHTSPFSPLPHPFVGGHTSRGAAVPRCVSPLECLLQLEGSGKWPDEVEAFLKMKAALSIQIAEELFTSFGVRAEASEQCLDVYADGFVFRMFIFSERDRAVAQKDRDFAAVHNDRQNRLKHHGMITQLAGHHPTLRATAELALRWTASQLMSNHVPQEATELIVAAAYISPTGGPGSPLAGLLSFLRLLAGHPWTQRPLVVDPEGEMDIAQRQACVSSFQKAQDDGFAPSLPVVTPLDPASAHWTATKPCAQVVQRLVALANRSIRVLEAQVCSLGTEPSKAAAISAWDPALADFDAAIILRKTANPTSDLALRLPGGKGRLMKALLAGAGFLQHEGTTADRSSKLCKAVLQQIPASVVKEWGSLRIQQELIVGFDPVQMFVELLEQRLGHLGMFFYDKYGGDIITIKWHSKAFVAQPVVAESAHTAMPVSPVTSSEERPKKRSKRNREARADSLCIPDLVRIMSDIRELGAGLVSEICLRRTSI